ncbi:MAG: CHAP domain-containing protein, partial [Candidatus Saccharibacteria bacterium]|nr:CHAP domain-containing protein [Candidatus Saccharibacteria bacterium]
AYEAYGIPIAWGNAYSWDDAARRAGYTVNNTPAAGTIGQDNSGTWGHVFWVESVNADGSINVTEYNNRYATQLYSGVYRAGDFGARKVSAAQAKRYNYIHLR